jgi:hypothetical protein
MADLARIRKITNETSSGRPDSRRLKIIRGSELALRAVEWLERDQIPIGALTLLAGMGGKGKSTMAAGYAARATRGRFDGKYAGQPVDILWVGNEDGREEVVGPRLIMAGADMQRIAFIELDSESLAEDVNIVSDIDTLREAIRSVDAKVVVLDPVVEYLPGATDSHNDMSVRQALRPLRNLADELEIAVIGLVHLNKGDTLDVASRIAGSAAFRNIARSVLVVADHEEQSEWRVVFQNKSNNGPESGRGRLYRIEGVNVVDLAGHPVFDSQGKPATTSRVVWGEWVDRDPAKLPAREQARESPKLDSAHDLLGLLLGDGPALRSKIEAEATLEGIGWRTVMKAKAEMKVEDRQFPEPGRQGPGPSWWKLPAAEWCAPSCICGSCTPSEVSSHLTQQRLDGQSNEWSATSPGIERPTAHHSDAAVPRVEGSTDDRTLGSATEAQIARLVDRFPGSQVVGEEVP